MKTAMMLAGALAATIAGSAAAHAENFTFTLASGTATALGEVFGLANNATSNPTDVTITGGSPSIVASEDFGVGSGTFTVQDNQITDFDYSSNPGVGNSELRLTPTNSFLIQITQSGDTILFGQAQFDAGSAPMSAAPEPPTWFLMMAGVGGIGLMLRRAKKTMGFRVKDAFAA